MEKKFNKVFVTSLCSHPKRSNVIALGFIHGRISIYTFHVGNEQLNEIWSTKLKQSIRAVQFSDCGALLFAVSSNKSFCIFDSETGQRLRCIRKGHSETPNCLCVLPSWISGQQVASGAEDGEVYAYIVQTFILTLSLR
jgi:WD40 repeat protein